ncbi:MAG: C39 family peptidase, partial [Phycisphaerae bacterium]
MNGARSIHVSTGPIIESLEARLLLDGALCEGAPAGWLSAPPPGYVYAEPESVGGDTSGGSESVLSSVPEYFWHHGCGPTAAAMVLAYYDVLGYIDYFAGDASSQTVAVNEAIASKGDGGDSTADPGTPGTGHVPDYAFYDGQDDYGWVDANGAPDPHPDMSDVNPSGAHADDCLADFMRTSRSSLGLTHGRTSFDGIDDGLIAYSNRVGYSGGEASNEVFGSGLTWDDLVGEIDAEHPMVFLVDTDGNTETDHFVPVIGYRTTPSQQYACYTTWAIGPGIHWYDWQGVGEGNDWGIYAATFFHPPVLDLDADLADDDAATRSGVFVPGVTTQRYTFTGHAGEVISLSLAGGIPLFDPFDPAIALFGPDQTPVYITQDNRWAALRYEEDTGGFPGHTDPPPVWAALAEDGTYTIQVQTDPDAVGGDADGPFTLTVTRSYLDEQLDVPYYDQAYTQWCAFTSMAMLVNFYACGVKPWEVAAYFDRQVDTGYSPVWDRDTAETFFGSLGLTAHIQDHVFSSTVREHVEDYVDNGNPVFLGSSSYRHAVVITGVGADGVLIHDPSGAAVYQIHPDIYGNMHHFLTWTEFESLVSFFLGLGFTQTIAITSW